MRVEYRVVQANGRWTNLVYTDEAAAWEGVSTYGERWPGEAPCRVEKVTIEPCEPPAPLPDDLPDKVWAVVQVDGGTIMSRHKPLLYDGDRLAVADVTNWRWAE